MVTFPANKLMFRQQVDGLAVGPAFRAMRHEGLKSLYKGVGPPLLQKTTSLSLMFGMYAWCARPPCPPVHACPCSPLVQSHAPTPARSWPLSDCLRYGQQLAEHTTLPDAAVGPAAAVLSGATEALLTPFERVQTLLQLPTSVRKHNHTAHAFMDLRRYGLREYYRGMSAIVVRNTLSNAMFFGLRGPLRDALPGASDHCQWCATLRDFVSGAMLGALISTVFFPINVAKSVMQRRVGSTFHGAVWTLKDVYRVRGRQPSQLYRGVSVNFMRALVSWGIINSAYEFLMEHVVGRAPDRDSEEA